MKPGDVNIKGAVEWILRVYRSNGPPPRRRSAREGGKQQMRGRKEGRLSRLHLKPPTQLQYSTSSSNSSTAYTSTVVAGKRTRPGPVELDYKSRQDAQCSYSSAPVIGALIAAFLDSDSAQQGGKEKKRKEKNANNWHLAWEGATACLSGGGRSPSSPQPARPQLKWPKVIPKEWARRSVKSKRYSIT